MFQNERFTRQLDLIPMSVLACPVTIIGAGAIGSWTSLSLAKMGMNDISVHDFDRVSELNLPSQFYPESAVGQFKVDALASMVKAFTGVDIKVSRQAYELGHFPGIVISAVDSMAVRKLIWENHENKSVHTKAIIDPRMGAENALMYVMKPMSPTDQTDYRKSLYSDAQAFQERCTAKATIYTANLLSGMVCKAVKDLLTKPDYLRTVQWDIAGNEFSGFKKQVS